MENFISQILELKNLELVMNELSNNKYYNNLKNNITKNIDGRICHNRVRILHAICKIENINSYLEIGVHNGASMSYVVSNNKPIQCYGIDLFDDTTGYYKTNDKISLLRTTSNINKNNKCSEINLIKGNSFSDETVKELESALSEKVDLLFIDGDHSYEGVKNDFLKYSKFVKSNGLIILDDFDLTYIYPGIMKFVYEHIRDNPNYKILGIYENNELIIRKSD